jgi:hypothetical protein
VQELGINLVYGATSYKCPMPLYFFDVTDNGRGFRDTEGTELADLEAPRQEALATLGEIARDKLPDRDRREFAITHRVEGRYTFHVRP